MITNTQLINYAKQAVSCGYVFGTWGKVFNAAIYRQKANQYPREIKAWPKDTYTCLYGTRTYDCSGLVKAASWANGNFKQEPVYNGAQDMGANGMYRNATKKGKIDTFDKVPGRLVFKAKNGTMTHVGIYVGNNKCVEAKGHKYGVIESSLSSGWTHWAQCSFIKEDTQPEPAPSGEKYSGTWPTIPKKGYFSKGDKGINVKRMQDVLQWVKPGCLPRYGSDGDLGNETYEAVKAVQSILGVKVDGLYGPKTQAAAKAYRK